MNVPDIHRLSQEDQQLIIEFQKNTFPEQSTKGFIAIEPFADLLDKVGMHEEAREYFQKIISSESAILTQARCFRKIAGSYINQRDVVKGRMAADKAVSLLQKLTLQDKTEKEEYVRALHVLAHCYYFQLNFEKLEVTVREIKKYLPDITDIELRSNLFHAISLLLYTKHRWYQFPEEAFSHLELQLQLTSSLGDNFHRAYTHCIMGHQYLFNEEFVLSREHFAKAIEYLDDKHFGQLLMAYNYTAVGYRMQNNLSMTEKWTNLTLEKARQTSNFSYVPFSYANLAWVYARRKNWLYAEKHARDAGEMWSATAVSYCYIFPLMECLFHKNELDEIGQLAFKLLHPRLKKFPDSLTKKLKALVKACFTSGEMEMSQCLEEVIDEAKLTGYF